LLFFVVLWKFEFDGSKMVPDMDCTEKAVPKKDYFLELLMSIILIETPREL